MPTFPRTIAPTSADRPKGKMAASSKTQRGSVQTRDVEAMGVSWEERWNGLRSDNSDVDALLAFIRRHARKGTFLDVTHPDVPGSGKAPNGTGSSGVTVDGGSQTGSTLDTTGWPVSTSEVVKEGDRIKVSGLSRVIEIAADADSDSSGNVTLSIDPPILSGNSPNDGASVTTTGVTYRAKIDDYTMPDRDRGVILAQVRVRFWEAV